MNSKILLIGLVAVLFLSMGIAAAESNMTLETYGDISTVTADDYEDFEWDDDAGQGYVSRNFQPRIIPEDYSYRQNIPDEINYSTDYEDWWGYYVSVVDEDGENIPDLEVRLVDRDTNEERMQFGYDEDEDAYWCCVSAMGVGNHSCKIMVDDYYYNIKPLGFNLEIVKSDVYLTLNEIYAVKGDYAIVKVKVTDADGDPIFDEGRVKFTVNGEDYYKNIDLDGAATFKVKMNKKGSFTYSAVYEGDENHNPSGVEKSVIHVLGTDKKSRTVSIKGYKVVIPLDKYKKLIKAKYTGKTYVYMLNTGKKIKQKLDIYDRKGKRTTKTAKSKIYIYVCYDGGGQYTGSLPQNQYVGELTTSNQHRSGNIVCRKWLFGYKQSRQFVNLNSAKVRQKLTGM